MSLMSEYAYGRRAESVILLTAGVHGLLGLACLAFALVLLWNVSWPEKLVGVPLVLFATAFLVEVWAHLYLLSHPPTMVASDDTVTIRAWPLLREPLVLTRDDVRRIDWRDHAQNAGEDVALLAPPFVRPNVLVRLNTPRTLPVNRLVSALFGSAGVPIGSDARVPNRKGLYDAIGLNTESEVRQPEAWPYPLR
jgi:hypothetical protein